MKNNKAIFKIMGNTTQTTMFSRFILLKTNQKITTKLPWLIIETCIWRKYSTFLVGHLHKQSPPSQENILTVFN